MGGPAYEALRIPLLSFAMLLVALLAAAIVFLPAKKIKFLRSLIAIYLCDRYPFVAATRYLLRSVVRITGSFRRVGVTGSSLSAALTLGELQYQNDINISVAIDMALRRI